MAGRLHGSARTTPRVRAELQASQETSILAQRFGLGRTTVHTWRSRTTTADAPMGPTAPCSTVLTPAEADRAAKPIDAPQGGRRVQAPHPPAARRRPGMPARQHPEPDPVQPASVPDTTRCPPLARSPDQASRRGEFAHAAIGFVHIDLSELRLAQGKLDMLLAIDRVSTFTCVAFRDDAGR